MKTLFLFFVVFSIITFSSAQIIYHEFNPPISLTVYEEEGDTTKYLDLDINNDSSTDIKFDLSYFYHFVTPQLDEAFASGVISLNESKVGVLLTTYPCNALSLAMYDTISNLMPRDTHAGIMYDYVPDLTCASFSNIRYLPVELNISDNLHYGWILLQTTTLHYGYEPNSYASLKIFNYAYNSVPGVGIIAGDTLSSISPNYIESSTHEDLVKIYPIPFITSINIESSVLFNNIQLLDSYGKIIFHTQNDVIKRHFDLTNIPTGIYFLKLASDEYFVIKKIIKIQ